MAFGRRNGSDIVDSLLLLEKVRCYLVEPRIFPLHINMAEIVPRPSFFIVGLRRADARTRRA